MYPGNNPKTKQTKKRSATETFCSSVQPRGPHTLWPETAINKVHHFLSNLGDKHLPSWVSKQLNLAAPNTRPEVVGVRVMAY